MSSVFNNGPWEYRDIKKKLRPADRKKLQGLMKAAQKKKKAGQPATFKAKLMPKRAATPTPTKETSQ